MLRLRINTGLCTKLDDERQELAALEWALSVLANVTGLDVDLTEPEPQWWKTTMKFDEDLTAQRNYVAGP